MGKAVAALPTYLSAICLKVPWKIRESLSQSCQDSKHIPPEYSYKVLILRCDYPTVCSTARLTSETEGLLDNCSLSIFLWDIGLS